MHSEKIKELDAPAPTYVEDPTLQPGTEVVAKAATPGSRWQTNLITKKERAGRERCPLHNSTYKGKAATIKSKYFRNGCSDGNAVHRVSGSIV